MRQGRPNIALHRLLAATLLGVAAAAPARPIGAITQQDGATFHGWACDPATPGAPVIVDFYANGVGTQGLDQRPLPAWARYKAANTRPDHFAGEVLATQPQPQADAGCGGGGHGFSFTLPRTFRSMLGPGTHQIHVFLRPTVGGGEHPPMPGSPFALPVGGRQQAVEDWYNGFAHACRSWKDKSWAAPAAGGADPGPSYRFMPPADGCRTDYPGGFNPQRDRFWVLESTNETKTFAPVYDGSRGTIDFAPDTPLRPRGVPVWRLRALPSPRGGTTFEHVLDKRRGRSAGTPLDSYSAAAIQTELGAAAPDLGANAVFLELWWRVVQAEGAPILPTDATAGLTLDSHATLRAEGLLPARYRFMVGMHIGRRGQPLRYNVEVNLFKSAPAAGAQPPATASFDLCNSGNSVEAMRPPVPCEQPLRHGPWYADDVGLFDRRSVANPIVYFDVQTLHRVAGLPQPSGRQAGFQRVLIPVGSLVRNAPWLDRPGLAAALPLKDGMADLDGLRLQSFYIASEIWGKARLAVQFERLNIFTFVAD